MTYEKQCCRQLARWVLKDAEIEMKPELVDSLAEQIQQNVQQALYAWFDQMTLEGKI